MIPGFDYRARIKPKTSDDGTTTYAVMFETVRAGRYEHELWKYDENVNVSTGMGGHYYPSLEVAREHARKCLDLLRKREEHRISDLEGIEIIYK